MTNTRRALVLANIFNLMAAIYFIIISIVALVQLRWYHTLTVTIKTRYLITSATSYFAFIVLIIAALILIALFAVSAINLGTRKYVAESPLEPDESTGAKQRLDEQRPGTAISAARTSRLVLSDAIMPHMSQSGVFCATLLYLASAVSLVLVLVVWLLNTGELVRDSISTQLETALSRYQFGNRSNHFSVAIDGMQDINNCCGSLDYTDFPHHRLSGLSSGHYPGSCCGKNIFGVNARVLCVPDEIHRAKQTTGCVHILANYYDLISILIVPVALASLFVNITTIALITIAKGQLAAHDPPMADPSRSNRFELRPNF